MPEVRNGKLITRVIVSKEKSCRVSGKWITKEKVIAIDLKGIKAIAEAELPEWCIVYLGAEPIPIRTPYGEMFVLFVNN